MSVLGIKNRMLILALLPGFVIALTLFFYFTYGQLEQANRTLQERGLTIARQLGPASEYGFITGNLELLGQLSTGLLQQDDVTGLVITDTERNIVFAAGESRKIPELSVVRESAEECADYGEQRVYCAPIIKTVLPVSDYMSSDDGVKKVIGEIYVSIDTTSLRQEQMWIIAKAIIITVVLLMLTGYFAVRMGSDISTPLVRLTDAVGHVANGELDIHTSSGAKGEIGTLEIGIDAMIYALRLARDEMQSRIDDATKQLRGALHELESKNRALEEQRHKAQIASEAKSRFLANMSHEIRTPLSGMVGLLFLLRHTHLSAEQQEYLENLEGSAASLRTLIDDILDLSRIEAGRLLIHEQEFVLRKLTTSVAVMLAPAAHQKDVELIVHIEPNVPQWVIGDPLRLRQVLNNLMGNAVKFTERGYVRLHISIIDDHIMHDKRLRFAVEDSGIGIDQAKLDYIFESFAQADESTTRRYGGSGLGTTISRELVTLMGGRIQVESTPGKGTSFSFVLPMLIGDDTTEISGMQDTIQILLLEENRLSAVAEIACLESMGYKVTLAENEPQLMDRLTESADQFQLVLVAENRRQGKWTELARRLSNKQRNYHLGALAYYDSNAETALFDMILHKPLDGESLMRRLIELGESTTTSLPSGKFGGVERNRSLTILVAEDDAINAKVMTFFLRQKGHNVIGANNGREALELLGSREFDIAFLDMRMPEVDGLMVARQWRSMEPAQSHLPMIAVTANVTREDRQACFDAGMDDFVSKPVDPDRLAGLLQLYAARHSISG